MQAQLLHLGRRGFCVLERTGCPLEKPWRASRHRSCCRAISAIEKEPGTGITRIERDGALGFLDGQVQMQGLVVTWTPGQHVAWRPSCIVPIGSTQRVEGREILRNPGPRHLAAALPSGIDCRDHAVGNFVDDRKYFVSRHFEACRP